MSKAEEIKKALMNAKRPLRPVGTFGAFWNDLDAVGLRIGYWLICDCGVSAQTCQKILPYVNRELFAECTQQWADADCEATFRRSHKEGEINE